MPKTFNITHEEIISQENLLIANKNASDCKRFRDEILAFQAHRQENIISLHNDLTYYPEGGEPGGELYSNYKVGKYRMKKIFEPKPRIIMALPYRDRVVQWAFYQKLSPLFDKTFIEHSYACREGKGADRARKVLQKWLRKVNRSGGKWYVLKLDISKYFYRVDHEILMKILSRRIKDELILKDLYNLTNCEDMAFGLPSGVQPELCDREEWIFNKGMPIGNLTSQMFANIYLNELDQYCKHELKVHYLIRYADDIIILFQGKKETEGLKDQIEIFLNEELRLDLNDKTTIRPAWLPVEFVGAIISPLFIKMRKSTQKRMKARMRFIKKLYEAGLITWQKVDSTMQSYFGLIRGFTAGNLLRKILDEFVFVINNAKRGKPRF